MSKSVKIITGIVLVILAVLAISSSLGNKARPGKVRIGIILPLSGPAAAMGEASKKSIDLALSNISELEKSKVEIIYSDDQLDPKQTVSVAQKLIDTDGVSALITYSSPTSVAASYIAEKSSIPMIGLGNSSDINGGKRWVIRYMLGPDAQAKAIEGMLLNGKYSRIALVWNQSDGPKSVHDALVKILASGGYKVVADEPVAKSENDFKTSIAKIKSAKPDVVMAYISPQVGVFAKQAKDLRLDIPLVSGPVFEIMDQIIAAQGGLDGQLFVANDNVAYTDAYHAKYGTYPTIAGDYAYDALTQLIKAISANDSKSSIVEFLKKDFDGVSGKYRYNGDGSFDVVQVVKKWDEQKFIVIK